MKYLGVPVSFKTLKNSELEYIDAKFVKKLDAWIGDTASSGGRLILLDSCLSNVATDTMHACLCLHGLRKICMVQTINGSRTQNFLSRLRFFFMAVV